MVHHSVSAEKAALGCCLASMEACGQICGGLIADDFYFEAHQIIFSAVSALYSKGAAVDLITVSEHMEQAGELDRVGGVEYLSDIARSIPSTYHADEYLAIIQDRSRRRKLADLSQSISAALDAGEPTEAVLSSLSQAAVTIAPKNDRHIISISDAASELVDYIQSPDVPGLMTGFKGLDNRMGGLRPGELILLAGRPAMGKTAMAISIALNMALNNHNILFAECEMPARDLTARFVSALSTVPLVAIRNKQIGSEADRFMNAAIQLTELPVKLINCSGWTVSQLRGAAMKEAATGSVEALIIDYLQLLTAERKTGSTNDMVADQTKRLKMLARELNIPIILLSQLNRSVESREDKRPRLSDLRDSGAIEQDADAVIFLYRGYVYDDQIPADKAEAIVSKLRNGPIGTDYIRWRPATASYHNP